MVLLNYSIGFFLIVLDEKIIKDIENPVKGTIPEMVKRNFEVVAS